MEDTILKELESVPYFLENWYNLVKENPSKNILVDGKTQKTLNVKELEDLSGRVYSYLKSQNIHKDDIIMLCMPRSIDAIVAMIGVWKCGAAFTIVEDDYAPDRISYIKKDSNCKEYIDKDRYDEIIKNPYEEGYVEASMHDAAFAVYTSGTTGHPKGIIQEYGNIKIDSVSGGGKKRVNEDTIYALISPLNFVATIKIVLTLINNGCALHLIPYDIVKNPIKLKDYFVDNKITVSFLSPSIIRIIGKELGPYMKYVFTGSEPANGISLDGIHLINTYSMSEGAFTVAQFEIDKPYDVCPVGKPNFHGISLVILDENDNELPDGEVGEIAFENPFMRGYMNLPEETKKAFRGGLYHTGDLGKKLPDGNLVLVGRSNDMIKINGNRIEPAEIEKQVKNVLKINQCIVKGFVEANRSFICAYYTDNLSFDDKEIREKLKEVLPYYMIPSYFVHIDEIPLLPNGKINKKVLEAPDIESYSTEYVEPRNEIEKLLCDKMAKVLGRDKVGIKDDFYQLGGDSLLTMNLLSEVNLDDLNSNDILQGCTPEKIAIKINQNKSQTKSLEELELEARSKSHKLTPSQRKIYEAQEFYKGKVMWNLPTALVLKDSNNAEKIRDAINKVLKENDVFSTVFTKDKDGEVYQHLDPSICQTVEIHNVSEEEFSTILNGYWKITDILDNRVYSIDMYRTEENVYVLMDIHHIIIDGSAYAILYDKIRDAYLGIESPMDTYYACLQQEEEKYCTDVYKEAKKYFDSYYGDTKWEFGIKNDITDGEDSIGTFVAQLDDINSDVLDEFESKSKFTRNSLFAAAGLLAQAKIDNKTNALLNWTFHYRMDSLNQNGLGMLAKFLPIGLRIKDNTTLQDVFEDLKTQSTNGMRHSICDWIVDNEKPLIDDTILYVYETATITSGGSLAEIGLSRIPTPNIYQAPIQRKTIQVIETTSGITLISAYMTKVYSKEKIGCYFENLKNMVYKILEAKDYDKLLIKDFI